MNIGQLPPFLIWPYALFHILTRQSLYFMLQILTTEQQNYYKFYDSVKETLERTADRTQDAYENSVGDGYGLMSFLKNTILLFLGGIFLVILKIYILYRHINYAVFVVLYYLSIWLFNQNARNRRHAND